MISFCTTGDRDYLFKGLALLQSLKDTLGEGNFELHWLCIDVETQLALCKLMDYDHIKIYSLGYLEKEDEHLVAAQNNPPSNYGSQRDNYIWALTPYFINYLLKNNPKIESLVYVDNDIQFLQSPQVILDVVGDKAMGVHTHRFKTGRKNGDEVGWFNVGVVVFQNNFDGQMLSNLWKEWVLNYNNPYREKYGLCGDQGYLCKLYELFTDKICVFDEDERISHLAPWCPHLNGRPIIFIHFSHFNFDLQENTWRDSHHGEWKPVVKHRHMRQYYENYFEAIKKASKLLS